MTWVLIVEDDLGTRDFLQDLLSEGGYSVLEASEGRAGLELLRASSDHLIVLLDYRLPDISGMDILREVAADTRLRRTHAYLLVTADARRFSANDQAMQQELNVPVIAKPFEITVLLDAIAQAQQRLAQAE